MKTTASFTLSQGLLNTMRRLNQAPIFEDGGQNVVEFLRDYHRAMDWRGASYLGGGASSGWFAKAVVDGWQEPRVAGNGVVIANSFGLLSWKVSGGTIVPKKAKMLTIPLVALAKGVAARQYPAPLFRAGNALCIKLGNKVKAVYALKKSVTQKPWPGAMPPNDQLQAKFMEGANKAIARAIGSS
jgi:hypothetical protein